MFWLKQIFFTCSKIKLCTVIFLATKNGRANNFPLLLVLLLDLGWIKIRIRDKHPGSATLLTVLKNGVLDLGLRLSCLSAL